MLAFEFRNGDMSGGHIDYLGRFQTAGKLKFLGNENGENGIYRAFVGCHGFTGKESSFWGPNISAPKSLSIMNKLLSKEDFTNRIPKNGKYKVYLPYGKAKIETVINATTSRVISAYPTDEKWIEPLAKKLFKKNKWNN